MIKTPCNLEVLLHCYYCPEVHPRIDAPAVQDAIRYLEHVGMIIQMDRHYETTPKGTFFVKHLMTIPFPVEVFIIPGTKKDDNNGATTVR